MASFDQLLESRLTFGLYQKRLIFLAFFANILIGAVQLGIFIVAQIVTREYYLDSVHTSIILSVPPAANLLASLIIGFLADVLGRHNVILTIYFLTLCAITSFYFLDSFYVLVVAFIICGLYNSCTINVMFAYVAENLPAKRRGKIQTFLSGMTGVGRLAIAGACALAFQPYEFGNWKIPFFGIGLALTVIFIGLRFFMKPSLQQQFKTGDYTGVMVNFSEIQHVNLSKSKASDEVFRLRKDELELARLTDMDGPHTKGKCGRLFGRDKFRKTFCLVFSRAMLSILFSGELAAAPFILGTSTKGLGSIAFFVMGEFTGTVVCALLIDRLGRRLTLFVSEIMILSSLIGQMFIDGGYYPYAMFFRRIFVKSGFTSMEVLFVESYEADLRSTSIGLSMSIGGGVVSVSNLFIIKLFNHHPNYLFGFWAIAIGLSVLANIFMPKTVGARR